jgi:DNA polymerase-3 subunit gamma/tau
VEPAPAAEDVPPWLDLPPEDLDAVALAPEPPVVVAADPPGPMAPVVDELPPGAPVAPAATPLEPTPSGQTWAELLPALGATALTRTLALQSQCLRLDTEGDTWTVLLRVASESLRTGPAVAKLEALLTQHAGKPVRLSVEAGPVTDSPALRDAAAAVARQQSAEAALEQSPELAALRRHFDTTRIAPGSIQPV